MIWNPLEYLIEDEIPQALDPREIREIGRKAGAVALEQRVPITGKGSRILGREVGDDRVDLSRTPDGLCTTLVVQEHVIHMVTSPEDTSIRKKSWNFCEVTGGPLTDPQQGFDFVRKNGDFSNLGFNDSVILRIISDVQKGDGEDHSSTQPGKMSMLGSRLATPRRENRGMWMLASLFQDSMLCTHKASEPKYLPPVMGGTGVTALFDNSNNVYLYVLSYRGGSYRRIYATAVAEMRDYLYNLERDVQSAPVLCSRLREKQEYFWGTYDNMVFVPKADIAIRDEQPPIPLYTATGGSNRFQAFENRLIRTKHVVSRKDAQLEWRRTKRLHSIFHGVFDSMEKFQILDNEESKRYRARYENALNTNTALQNLLRREAGKEDAMELMGSSAFLTCTQGKRDFTRLDAEWVYLNGQGETYSLRDVDLSEDIFLRSEVSAEETFKVGGIHLRPFMTSGTRSQMTSTKVGLYKINQSQEEWSDELTTLIENERNRLGRPLEPAELLPILRSHREWVNDDMTIIAMCLNDVQGRSRYTVCLVSDDRKLANKLAETCNVTVKRVSPKEFVPTLLSQLEHIDENTDPRLCREYGVRADFYYLDTGSCAAVGSQLTRDLQVWRRVLRATGWHEGRRFSEVTLHKMPPALKFRVEVHRPIQRPRTWRQGSRPYESVYSEHSSWYSSRRSESSVSNWWRRTDPSEPETHLARLDESALTRANSTEA